MFTNPVGVDDGYGYVLRPVDMQFVGLTDDDLMAVGERTRPLGTTPGSFGHFLRGLSDALNKCRVADFDVRLQGSAARVFSGPHKSLPSARDDVFALMRTLLKRVPHSFELDEVEQRMSTLWPPGTQRPRRPFFDLLYQLRVDGARSDIDIQLSSNDLLGRAEALAADRGVSLEALQVERAQYHFLTDDAVEEIAWELLHWADDMSTILRRPVAVKIFGGDGPPDVRGEPGVVTSSHFQEDDWVLTPLLPGPVR